VALIDLAADEQLAVKTDAIVAGVHFLAADPPDLIARKLLRVNLSDLAGKGARPLGYLMTCALPADLGRSLDRNVRRGLAADQREFGPRSWGRHHRDAGAAHAVGDCVRRHPQGPAALARRRASPAMPCWSGHAGGRRARLDVQRQDFPELDDAGRAQLMDRYRLPRPRLKLGRALAEAGFVHASMDISDGLLADLGHICRTSKLGADIEWPRVPLSEPAAKLVAARPPLRERIVAAGDDYELLLTVAAGDVPAALSLAQRGDVRLTPVGVCAREPASASSTSPVKR
jgi:thiamine-monophosphate kinase